MRHLLSAGTIAVTMMLVGCGGRSYFADESYTYPITIDDQSRALVMPVQLHVEGDTATYSAAFMSGIGNACEHHCLPGQPVRPLLEQAGIHDLTWTLAEGMYHAAKVHHRDVWDHDYASIPGQLAQLHEAIGQAFPNEAIRWLVVGHVDSVGSTTSATAKLRVIGGLFDLDRNRMTTVFWYDESMPAADVPVRVSAMGTRVFSLAICPMDGDSCRATAHALEIDDLHYARF